jgi:hypothetical protein
MMNMRGSLVALVPFKPPVADNEVRHGTRWYAHP